MTGLGGLKAHSPACRSSSGLAWNAEGLDGHQGNAYMPGPAQVPHSTAPPPPSSEGLALRGGGLAEPELQAARDSAHSFEVHGCTSCVSGVRTCWERLGAVCILCTVFIRSHRPDMFQARSCLDSSTICLEDLLNMLAMPEALRHQIQL